MEETAFNDLVKLMAQLRGPDGCLWDKEQDHRSLQRYVIEEAYEVVDAIERENMDHLKDELGDLLLQVVFQSRIAEEKGRFNIWDVIANLNEKIERRHPHIFGEVSVESAAEVKRNWDNIKEGEKTAHGAQSLRGVPRSLPALLYALELQELAAKVGFDWPDTQPVREKIHEELSELGSAIAGNGDKKAELGDVLFAIVNLSRHLKINPEVALMRTAIEFDRRFEIMEELAIDQGATLADLDLQEQDKLWEKAKEKRNI